VNDQLLEWLSVYGLPVFFGILVIASAGMPFPVTLMLIFAGSLVEQGEMDLWKVIALGSAGAVIGDQIGYGIGKYGGKRLLRRLTNWIGGEEKVKKAVDFINRWGGVGIFFSRWLITPLGPWLNITSGATEYAWKKFVFWDIAGEIVWVVLYVALGYIFSDSVQEVAEFAGNITWGFFGLIITAILGWKLFQYFRGDDKDDDPGTEEATDAVYDAAR
jgi:membrane protein DedA with SNARE-associated domain